MRYIIQLKKSEKLIMCGQAMSHCVHYTVRDFADHWPKEEMGKLVILKDCASTIPGFEDASDKFLSDMVAAGVNVETTETLKI
jgi:nicotinamidase/pyrazinamidase